MLDLPAIAAFVQTAEDRSFTVAARRLGMGQSTVSKAVSKLEAALSVKLLNRSTRSVTLTAEGAVFHERCRKILSDLDEVREEITKNLTTPRGTLRITSPLSLGELVLAPNLAIFAAQNQTLKIEVMFANQFPDFVEGRIDAALWMSELPDTTAVARKIGLASIVTCAAPRYLKERGTPIHPEQLGSHVALAHIVHRTGAPREWIFSVKGTIVRARPPIRVLSENSRLLLEMAAGGQGIVQVPLFIAADRLKEGKLVRILAKFDAPGAPTYIVYPDRHLPLRTKAFIDFLLPLFVKPEFKLVGDAKGR